MSRRGEKTERAIGRVLGGRVVHSYLWEDLQAVDGPHSILSI